MNITATPPRASRREWIGLAIIALPCLLYAMDLTVLYLAIPALNAALAPSSAQLLWIVDIYGFVLAGSLITMGKLGDRIGRRRLLLIGAAVFGAVSVFAAFSTSAAMLIAARALLGIAGATLAPSTLSLIRSMFPDPEQRTFAIGVWIASFSAGGAIGPVVGGILLAHFWWGSVFLVSVPVMLLLLVLGPILLPEFRDPAAGRLDLLSVVLSLAAVLAVIYGLKQVAQDGVAWLPALSIVIGFTVGIVYLRRQRTLADPMIDLRLFRVPAFGAALATNTLGFFVLSGVALFIAQYMQLVLGLSPFVAGLWMLPSASALIVGSLLTPVIVRRMRPALVMGVGLVIAAIGAAVLTRVAGPHGLAVIVTGDVLLFVGITPMITLATDLMVGAAPPERAGAAAAVSETSSEFGGALGIAILGSVGTAVYRLAMTDANLDGVMPDATVAARGTLSGATEVAMRLPGQRGAELLDVAHGAFAQAFTVAAAISTLIMIALAIAATVLLRHVQVGTESDQRSGPVPGEAVAD